MGEGKGRLRHRRGVWIELRMLVVRLKMSLWFVPTLCVLFAVGLAHLLTFVDELEWFDESGAWFMFGGDGDSAQELLSTLATGVITLTGVVFSITVLVLQLASSQYTPRVLRTFLSDRKTQAAMGLFLGTFAYNIVLLTKVRTGNGGDEFVPALSVFLGYVAVLVSVIVFVDYIHHMAHSIRAVNIIKRVAEETRRLIERHFPEEAPSRHNGRAWPEQPPTCTVNHVGRAGVVTQLDTEALCTLACQHDARFAVVPRTGDFVPKGGPLAHVWGTDIPAPQAVRNAIGVEDERASDQDMAYGFRQLVDIASRALSQSTNDPSTAVQVLDRLHDLLRALVVRPMPSGVHTDPFGQVRVWVPQQVWESYVGLACDEIRHYGKGSMQVVRRLRAMLLDLLTVAPPERRAALEQQLTLLDTDVQHAFSNLQDRSMARTPNPQGHGLH